MLMEIIRTSFWHFFFFCLFLTAIINGLIILLGNILDFIAIIIRGHKKDSDTIINNYYNGEESGKEE